jgi:tRNA-binding protein
MIKAAADFSAFLALDIRVGKIVAAVPAQTKKPTYRMTVDFGSDVGTRISCGAYTNYAPDELVGKQVVAVLNFGAKMMGPEVSEALILGVKNPDGVGTLLLTVDKHAAIGSEVF